MKLVIQRVLSAKLSVDDKIVSEIGRGLFVLVGIGRQDLEKETGLLAEKLSKLRIMADSGGKMNLSVKDVNAELLVVSQFTLYVDTTGGNRPSFIKAASPQEARALYDCFVSKLKSYDISVKTGIFGACMKIEPVLDGPVTIVVDSSEFK